MKVIVSLDELRSVRSKLKGPVGFVPTMGFLHEGHLSLVRRAFQDNRSVVVSIYVNPAQFGPHEDLQKYPRDLKHDLDLLRPLGVDIVWTPTNEMMYPGGYQTWVTVEEVTQTLEGAMRPGHFRGVTTIVSKLFNVVQPQKAYFGQKDAQQAVVIRQLVRDLNFPIDIVICPTVREADGLAMSSRNIYLAPPERKAAVVLSQALYRAKSAYEAGEKNADQLRKVMQETLAAEPLVKVQYVSCADFDRMCELDGQVNRALLSMAVTIGKTHLIDNILI